MRKLYILLFLPLVFLSFQKNGFCQDDDRKNKVAILPFDIASNDQGLVSESMSKNIQSDCEASFEKNTSLQVVSARTVNAVLIKNNIPLDNITTAPAELASMLGVEYVVFGTVEIQNSGSSTYGSSSSGFENKTKKKDDKSSNTKGYSYGSNSSSTSQNYRTHLRIEMYDGSGNKVHSASRSPFGTSADSYRNGIDYMVKRTPFGSKHK